MKALLALFALFPVFADAAPIGAASSGVMPWLVVGMLVICVGASIWVSVSNKKKK